MNRESNRIWRELLIAFSAVWILACAFGSGFLHESIGCSHDLSAETVDHAEDDSAHWAALRSDIFESSDCPVCITCSAFAIDESSEVRLARPAPTTIVVDSHALIDSASDRIRSVPRAPPIS